MSDHSTVGTIDPATFDRLYSSLKHWPNTAILEFLAAGGDPNLRFRQRGWTLLHAASYFGRREIVEALLENGADVEALTDPGFTPLAMAAHSAQPASVRVLLAAGTSLDCRPLGVSLIDSLAYARRESRVVREILVKAATQRHSSQ